MKHLITCWSNPWMETLRAEPTADRRGVRNTIRHIADAIGQDRGAGAAFVLRVGAWQRC